MVYQATRAEANALHYLALALRPDWANNSPGETWAKAIPDRTFQHAENYEHCINALVAYCQESKDGKPVKRTPNLFTSDGKHWESTRPKVTHENPRMPCPDHKLDKNNYYNCISCRSEIITGDRPSDMQGKQLYDHGPATTPPRKDAA